MEKEVGVCLAYQVATPEHQRDMLKLNQLPEGLWKVLYCDHWGPTQDNKHVLVVIDALSKFPEVVIINRMSMESNI